ncbi:MAG: DUF2975 domain-containing protein [Acetobacter sp.]|nr:DUF2975 domain-containing protein [Bacteroides sp.]MCM1341501.1 DUF2975 domain-containing protein [Acetobacter sp.]MCM1433711.1 DUF2975 domain-containing protein [Clostridiales bacterium]
MKNIMNNTSASVKITHFAVRLCYVLLTAAAIGLPIILFKGFYNFEILGEIKDFILIPFYFVVPAGYVALFCLDRLLINIRKGIVFDKKNVKILRTISIACLYAGLVGIVSFIAVMILDFMFETLLILAMGEIFMALVVRVVQNVFEKAIDIKEENDLTI